VLDCELSMKLHVTKVTAAASITSAA